MLAASAPCQSHLLVYADKLTGLIRVYRAEFPVLETNCRSMTSLRRHTHTHTDHYSPFNEFYFKTEWFHICCAVLTRIQIKEDGCL